MDIQRSLRTVIASGKVLIGADQTAKAIDNGEAKLVVLAAGNPRGENLTAAASQKHVPVYAFQGTNNQLGPACGKPFAISALAVLDAGDSDILQLAK